MLLSQRVSKLAQRHVQLKTEGIDAATLVQRKGLANALLRFAQSSLSEQADVGASSARASRAVMLMQRLEQTDSGGHTQGIAARALFSRADREVSCEGVAGRALMVQAVSTGRTLYWEGIFLLIIAVVIGFIETGGLCFTASRPANIYKDAAPVRQIVF